MLGIARQENLDGRSFIIKVARCRKRIAAIIAAARENADAFAAHRAQQVRHGRCRLPAGIFHQQDFRQAVDLAGPLIYQPHFLHQ